MESVAFTVVALGVLGFGLVSSRVERSVITLPMVFVLFGYAVSHQGLDLVELDLSSHLIHTLAELTLVLVLFADASRIDLNVLRREHNIPMRLLLGGLPLTVVAGALVGVVLFGGFSIWQALVLAIILAPTDAALGQAVVSSDRVPVRIRQALNVESGLNDGVVLPVLLIVLSVACATESIESAAYWLRFVFLQLTIGPLIGALVGFGGAKMVALGVRSGWMSHSFQSLSSLCLALLAFAGAELLGGNGFIAAFCAGLVLGHTEPTINDRLYHFAEAEGQLLILAVFMVFGGVMVPEFLAHLDWRVFLYALLSLTVIRMLPAAVSLLGARLRLETVFFLGWFGPRGLASILFALLVLENSELPGKEQLSAIVMATVALSVFAHGLSAYPATRWYASRLAGQHAKEEHLKVSEMPMRQSQPR